LAIALCLLSCLFALGCSRTEKEPPAVTILCYHNFGDKNNAYSVSVARFDEEMRFLYVQKIPIIPLSALEDHLSKKTPLPDRSVVITIDDGYKTAKDIAWPVFKRYGYPFTLYVYPHAVNRFPSALTWDDLRLMARQGVDIQSHSLTHPLLTHPGKPMNRKNYHAWIEEELAGSKRRIETELQQPVTSIAYPYGGYDQYIAERARALGYHAALTCDDGDVAGFTDPYRLNRRLVFRQTSLQAFARSLNQRPLQVTAQSPADGERVKEIPKEIRARILDVEKILPESAQIQVDKVGRHWMPVPIDPKTGEMTFALPRSATRRGYYFVSLVAKDRANPALLREASWLFIVRRNTSKK
jgi:peptidoglycan/xylan/chitin deacetylase (PgdA/CDA1 family)